MVVKNLIGIIDVVYHLGQKRNVLPTTKKGNLEKKRNTKHIPKSLELQQNKQYMGSIPEQKDEFVPKGGLNKNYNMKGGKRYKKTDKMLLKKLKK
jgi:hypothetical protein